MNLRINDQTKITVKIKAIASPRDLSCDECIFKDSPEQCAKTDCTKPDRIYIVIDNKEK